MYLIYLIILLNPSKSERRITQPFSITSNKGGDPVRTVVPIGRVIYVINNIKENANEGIASIQIMKGCFHSDKATVYLNLN